MMAKRSPKRSERRSRLEDSRRKELAANIKGLAALLYDVRQAADELGMSEEALEAALRHPEVKAEWDRARRALLKKLKAAKVEAALKGNIGAIKECEWALRATTPPAAEETEEDGEESPAPVTSTDRMKFTEVLQRMDAKRA